MIELSDAEIVEIAEECGLCTLVHDAGYYLDALWFDGELLTFARAIISSLNEK